MTLARHISSKKPFSQFLAFSGNGENDAVNSIVYRRFGNGQLMSFGLDGVWRWRFQKSYSREQDSYARLWNQTMLWLIHNSEFLPGQEYSFRHDTSSINLGEKVNFRFSVRTPENIPQKAGTISIRDAQGKRYEIELQADDNAPHRFTASFEPPLEGKYLAEYTTPDGTRQELAFIAVIDSLEEKEVNVNREYLEALSQATGGRLITSEELKGLHKLIGDQALSQEHQRVYIKAIWDKFWLMYLICAMLGLDWFFRRKWGLC
jgi:hypothetical protein